ncbi:MAG: response regulator [Proteobacteria bacterium]|nr:response regulator [Pseudomonadota bacterium]
MKKSLFTATDLSSLLNAAPDGLVIINQAGKIVYVNAQTLTLFGYASDELLGETIEKLLPNRYHSRHIGYRQSYFINPHIRHMGAGLDLYGVKKGGAEFPVEVSLSPLQSAEGALAFAAIRDVTEIKALEKTRLEAIQRAKEFQQSRADEAESYRRRQEQIVDALCHELRNPLQGIYGNVVLLKQNFHQLMTLLQPHLEIGLSAALLKQVMEQFEQMKDSVHAIETCADHQKIIADDVLSLSKLEAQRVELNFVVFDPKHVVSNVIKMLKTVINDKKLELIEQISTQKVMAGGDPDRLAQVLINLLTNAIKFTPAGGSITVTLDCITPVDPGDPSVKLQFAVRDTGIGMTPDEQGRIFDRFAQGSRKTYQEYGGSGLGLMISKNLIELMGGEIHVVSEKGAGSTFSFYVQCTRCAPTESPKMEFATCDRSMIFSKTAPLTGHIILIVEDNLINQKILVRQLERAGVKCYVANNGQEAIDSWQAHSEITCILMDIEMPILNGLEATKLIRLQEQESKRSTTPIIGLSGNAGEVHIAKALESGMDGYLTKPYKIEELSQKILYWRSSSPRMNYRSLKTRKELGDQKSKGDQKELLRKDKIPKRPLRSKAARSSWLSYLLQSAHRGDQYKVEVAGQKKIFTVYEIKSDGNCGFHALGVSRREAVDILLGLIHDLSARKSINNELIEGYRNYQVSDGAEIDPTQFMEEPTRRQFARRFAAQQWEIIQNDEALFKAYVKSYDHHGGGLWLGVRSMYWIAHAKHLGFHLWGIVPSTRTLQLLPLPDLKSMTVSPIAGSVNILIQGGHYNFLVEETEDMSLGQSGWDEVKLFKKPKTLSPTREKEPATVMTSSLSASGSRSSTASIHFPFASGMSSSFSGSSSASGSTDSVSPTKSAVQDSNNHLDLR